MIDHKYNTALDRFQRLHRTSRLVCLIIGIVAVFLLGISGFWLDAAVSVGGACIYCRGPWISCSRTGVFTVNTRN